MEILVNGELRMARTGQTVSELLAELSLDARLVVVELNREILRRGELSRVRLEPGDQVELVNFVGGG
jgi:sulfur carrier protein